MVPTFFLGVIVFVFILLMFQVLNLTDTLLQHDVSIRTLVHLLSYMSISFLPALLPMSLIFAVILSYNRLTNDSEIIAMKSLGLSMWPLIMPGIALGIIVSIASGYMTFKIGPWGNRRFELLITDIATSKTFSAIKEGTFTEDFANLVVYTNGINKKTDELEKVFIYDERDPNSPTTIISEKGKILNEKSFNSYKIFVRLINGDIHKISDSGHTKIHFQTYDLNIVNPIDKQTRGKSIQSMTYADLKLKSSDDTKPKEQRTYLGELHKRFSLSFSCLLFVLLGVGLGCRTNSRSGKSGGGVTSVGVIVVYWCLFVAGNSLIGNPQLPIWLGAWLPSIILFPASLFFLRKNWN